MKKKIGLWILKIWEKPLTKIIIYIIALFFIITLSSGMNDKEQTLWDTFLDILTSNETISFFSAGIVTVVIVTIISSSEKSLEESLKIEDNHHKIIAKYNKHPITSLSVEEKNFCDKNGVYMELHHIVVPKKEVKNKVKDIYSSEYKSNQKELDILNKQHKILLPTINIFTNREENVKVLIDDSLKEKKLPDFVISNGQDFMNAHKHSKTSNNVTIRLDDISFENNILTLHTSRTLYYHMLLTNRCMDYKISNGMSIRGLYEFDDKITTLKDSKLSNQIGINGMILTLDGYVLLEKRTRNKTTWKNKFAQPNSLALKEKDLKLDEGRLVKKDLQESDDKLMGVLKSTMKSNFGLTEKDYETLSFENNFLGIARDLLEGGKPNMYFVVTVNYNAEEFLEVLRKNASSTTNNVLKKEKLESDYYLIHFEDLKINYDYELKVKKSKVYKVDRVVYPRCSKHQERSKKMKYNLSKVFRRYLEYGCGEALLVSLSYLEICQPRLEAIKDKGVKSTNE